MHRGITQTNGRQGKREVMKEKKNGEESQERERERASDG